MKVENFMKLDFVVLAAGFVHEQWKTVTQSTKCSVRDWQRSNEKASKKWDIESKQNFSKSICAFKIKNLLILPEEKSNKNPVFPHK